MCGNIFYVKSTLNCHVKNIHENLHTKTTDVNDAYTGVGCSEEGSAIGIGWGWLFKEFSDTSSGSETDSDSVNFDG